MYILQYTQQQYSQLTHLVQLTRIQLCIFRFPTRYARTHTHTNTHRALAHTQVDRAMEGETIEIAWVVGKPFVSIREKGTQTHTNADSTEARLCSPSYTISPKEHIARLVYLGPHRTVHTHGTHTHMHIHTRTSTYNDGEEKRNPNFSHFNGHNTTRVWWFLWCHQRRTQTVLVCTETSY